MTIKLTDAKTVGMSASRLLRIKEVMRTKVEDDRYAGISTLVARRGKVVHFSQVGFQDKEANIPLRADTIFRLYSMTKPIICTAFMCLYEQGKVDLNEPVANYIPAFANLKVLQKNADGSENLVDLQQPVAIFHLLTHTAGLSYDFYDDYSISQSYREAQLHSQVKDVSLEDFINKLCQFPLAFQPGTQWHYSVSIDVLARLIEIIADKPLVQFLEETIFTPLGMLDMAFYQVEEKRSRMATIYGGIDLCAPGVDWQTILKTWASGVNKKLEVDKTDPVDDPNFYRGGLGLSATAEDYFRFAQMLLNQGEFNGVHILSRKTIALMHMNHLDAKLVPIQLGDFKLMGYGFGLGSRVLVDVAASKLAGSIGEYGWAGAAKTYYWIDPKEELIGIFLTQSMCDFSMIQRTFQALTYQALID